MLSFTTARLDEVWQPLRPHERIEVAAIFPAQDSSCTGSTDVHGGSSIPNGNRLTFSLSTENTCSPQIGSLLDHPSSYPGREEDVEHDSEFEAESAARMQSLVPSGLLQDDGLEHLDTFPLFPSERKIDGININTETVLRHQAISSRVLVHPSYSNNGFVATRRDQGFDFGGLSNDEGFAGEHVPIQGRMSFPVQEAAFQHEATGRANNSATPPSTFEPFAQVAADNLTPSFFSCPQLIAGGFANPRITNIGDERFIVKMERRLRSRQLQERAQFQKLQEFSRKEREELLRELLVELMEGVNQDRAILQSMIKARLVPRAHVDDADSRLFNAQGEYPGLQEGFCHKFQEVANNIDQSSLLKKNNAVLTVNPLSNPPTNYVQQVHPNPGNSGLERGRPKLRVERLQQEFEPYRYRLDLRARAIINAELPQRNGFSSLGPKTVNDTPIPSAATTSSDSIRATIHSAALGPRSRDLKQEVSCRKSRSLIHTKSDGYHCSSFSPLTGKSSTSYGLEAKALIAQGVKSISAILKPDHSRSGSSYPRSPVSNDSTPGTPRSGSLSPIRPRRLNMSNTDALQLIPMKNPSVELEVCNQGQFKTELCNNWQEAEWCRYGEHCRFAHGVKELRPVLRHHRYKSVPCRMIMSGKECIYGHRCHYRHSLTEKELSLISEARLISRKSL